MKIVRTDIDGVMLIENLLIKDNRGIFCKIFNKNDFEQHQMNFLWQESYYSRSKKNTIRGMHFQMPPHDHDKLVYVASGAIEDVVLDLRKKSKTYMKAYSFFIDSKNGYSIYTPKGLAHGFKTLEDNSITVYHVSSAYNKLADSGIKWNSFGYDWKLSNPIISERDDNLISLKEFRSPF